MKKGNTKTEKHIPMRTCIATRQKLPKNELIRIVKHPETGELVVDLKSKIRARGANLMPSEEAFDLMVKKKALPRALKIEGGISDDEYSDLKNKFIQAIEEKAFRPNNKPVRFRVRKEDVSE